MSNRSPIARYSVRCFVEIGEILERIRAHLEKLGSIYELENHEFDHQTSGILVRDARRLVRVAETLQHSLYNPADNVV